MEVKEGFVILQKKFQFSAESGLIKSINILSLQGVKLQPYQYCSLYLGLSDWTPAIGPYIVEPSWVCASRVMEEERRLIICPWSEPIESPASGALSRVLVPIYQAHWYGSKYGL